jgi:hypothetical protein
MDVKSKLMLEGCRPEGSPAGLGADLYVRVKRRPTVSALIGSVTAAGLGFLMLTGFQAAARAQTERRRLETARAEIHETLVRAEIAAKDESWEAAEQLYAGARNKIESGPEPADPGDEDLRHRRRTYSEQRHSTHDRRGE